MVRKDKYKHLIYFKQLVNKYSVIMYAKIKMKYTLICINEAKLRADNYINLQDVLRNEGIKNLAQLDISIVIL